MKLFIMRMTFFFSFILCICLFNTAALAEYTYVSLGSYYNTTFDGDLGADPPDTLGNIPFYFGPDGNQFFTNISSNTVMPTITLSTSVSSPTTVYLLLNTSYGPAGFAAGSVTFVGTNSDEYTVNLVCGQNIRDWNNDGNANTLTDANAQQVYSHYPDSRGSTGRIDMLTVNLPSSFENDTLQSIVFRDNGRGGVSYLMIEGVTVSSGASGLWEGAQACGSGWEWLKWFGFFNTNSSPWIYHDELGWLYPVATSTDSIWFWDAQTGDWWWTSATVYPSIYSVKYNAWLWYQEGSFCDFYNFGAQSWMNICSNPSAQQWGISFPDAAQSIQVSVNSSGSITAALSGELSGYDSCCDQSYSINLLKGGSLSNQIMTFNLGGSPCGGELAVTCTGTLDASFPNAITASGSCSGALSDPCGTQPLSGDSWDANRTQ